MKENIKRLLASGVVSNYKISKDTGIRQSSLSDYATGKSDIGNMKLDHAEILNQYYEEEVEMKFKVKVIGHPNVAGSGNFEIKGECLIDAIKSDFKNMVTKSVYGHVPFRYPMTANVVYKKGILGGRGGVVVECSWMYASHSDRPAELQNHEVWIYADESDLKEAETFEVE